MPPEIVLIDDHRVNLLLVKELLQDNFRVKAFHSPVKALNYIVANPPALVICDLMMPKLNGLEILEIVKALYPATTFFILTAHDDQEAKRKAFLKGVDAYLLKPLNVESFHHNVQHIMNNLKEA